MPPADVLGELRGMVAQAAAKIRAMSDGELVTRFLELGGGTTVLESEPETPAARPRKPRATKPAPAATAPRRPGRPAGTVGLGTIARRDLILEHLNATDFVPAGAIAKAVGGSRHSTAYDLRVLLAESKIESNGRSGKACAYRLKSSKSPRQTGAKPKAPKPPASDDEEPAPVEKPRKPAFVELMEAEDNLDDEIPAPPDSEPSTVDTSSARVLGPIRKPAPLGVMTIVQKLSPSARAPRDDDDEVSGVHRLPVLEDGPGERHNDCIQYDGCLTRFVNVLPRATFAHCPPGCGHHETPPTHVRIARATVGSSPLSIASER